MAAFTTHSVRHNEHFRAIVANEHVKQIGRLFAKIDKELRIAGGAPRDILCDTMPHDLDFATTAKPDEMVALFETEQIRMLNTNGIKHGTVTIHLDDDNYEITTLRIDKVTDGRHAEVEFTEDWQIDANRRDLTVNSLFLTLDGDIIDYHNGVDDIERRRVRFVGNAADRICEDYLRIMRYFRFYSRLSLNGNDHELSTLRAIEENGSGLAQVSGERIWAEMAKIVAQPFHYEFFDLVYRLNIDQFMGLPKCDFRSKATEYKSLSNQDNVDVLTRLAVLFDTADQIEPLDHRLKLSKREFEFLHFLVGQRCHTRDNHPDFDTRTTGQKYEFYFKLKATIELKIWHSDVLSAHFNIATGDWAQQLAIYLGEDDDLIRQVGESTVPAYPGPNAQQLMSCHKLQKGPIIARMQTMLKRAWVETMCSESHEEQVARIPQVLDHWRKDGYVDMENRWTKKRSASPTGPKLKQRRK